MRIFEIVDIFNIKWSELDVCVYLMSAVAVQMEVEEGANATVTELLAALLEEEELGLPRATQEILREGVISFSSAKSWTQSIKSNTLGRSDTKHYLRKFRH